jgi:flagellar biosynthesis/type III secretory pathway M-ring protein FliF/YscJ
MESIRVAVVLILAVVAFFAILKPMARRALRLPSAQMLPAPALAGGGVRTVADMEGEIEAEILAGVATKAAPRRLPVLTKRIARGVDQQPEHAAKLVRNWLIDEEK